MPKNEEKVEKLLLPGAALGIALCGTMLLPQTQNLIMDFIEKAIGRGINREHQMDAMAGYLTLTILCLSAFLSYSILSLPNRIEKHGKKILIHTTIGIVAMSAAVITVMYIKARSFWPDEAVLATGIVPRSWRTLLEPTLNTTSAPILYIITLKAIGSFLGYSEFSLRIFSFAAFAAFLASYTALLKKALKWDISTVAPVVAVCALLPAYIWYANELKPYMSDTFFITLTLLLHFYYTQGKIKLPALTALYLIIVGFSFPAAFFIGGALLYEFLAAASVKDKLRALYVFISGIAIIAAFTAYYLWWMAPVRAEYMVSHWDDFNSRHSIIERIRCIFSPRVGNSDSPFVWLFVPFALLGIYPLVKSKTATAAAIILSLLLTFFASTLGMWPLSGRLWLFLPAIVLILTPAGFDFIARITSYKKLTNQIKFAIFSGMIIYLSINCLKFTGDQAYFRRQEVNPLIAYVRENIKEGEKLYVYALAEHPFMFKNNYNAKRIGNVERDNVIIGKEWDEWNENITGSELRTVLELESEKTYLLFQQYSPEVDGGSLAALRHYGRITEVMRSHDTPLYTFEKGR